MLYCVCARVCARVYAALGLAGCVFVWSVRSLALALLLRGAWYSITIPGGCSPTTAARAGTLIYLCCYIYSVKKY